MTLREQPPFCSWDAVPLTVSLKQVAALYDLHWKTAQVKVRRGDASLPRPFLDRPYRFRKSDVKAHYERVNLADVRRARATAA